MTLPVGLWPRVERQESGGNPNAVSPKGAWGVAQLMPGTTVDPGFGVKPFNFSAPDPVAENRRVGQDYLSAMYQRYGDVPTALVAYNWGPGNADKWVKGGRNFSALPDETQGYVKNILGGETPTDSGGNNVPGLLDTQNQDIAGLLEGLGRPQSTLGTSLLNLGAGIASGASQGWGAGIGRGLALAGNAQQEAEANNLRRRALAMQMSNQGPKPTDDMREFELAKMQGYQGNFLDFQKEVKGAGATNVTVGGGRFGTIPSGYELVDGPEGTSMRPIPGSPQAAEADAAAKAGESAQQGQADKASTMLGTVADIREVFKGAETPATGTASIPFSLYSETPAGKVRSYVKTLQSGVALGAMQRLKEASATGATGFGALNKSELDLLISEAGALDPNTTSPEIFLKSLDRIEKRWQRVVEDIKKNVTPERQKELGLDAILQMSGSGQDDGWKDMGGGIRIREKK